MFKVSVHRKGKEHADSLGFICSGLEYVSWTFVPPCQHNRGEWYFTCGVTDVEKLHNKKKKKEKKEKQSKAFCFQKQRLCYSTVISVNICPQTKQSQVSSIRKMLRTEAMLLNEMFT